jgi:hypothetical protein
MRRQTVTIRRGFTLTELGAVLLLAPIVMLSMGLVLADSQRGWNQMYESVNNGLEVNGHVARRAFDAIVRKSSVNGESFDVNEVEVHYHSDPVNSIDLDRYARFYKAGTELRVEHGQLDSNGNPADAIHTVTLCDDVGAVNFSKNGASIQMVLRLDDGSKSHTVMTSAMRQTEDD